MTFCGNCGAEHQGSKFCPNCGTPQEQTGAGQHQPPKPQEEESAIWEGASNNMTSAVSNGRLSSCRYRLTTRNLYFDEGLLSSNSQLVPLWAVRDVDVKQGMIQRARGVGTVTVHVEHSDFTGRSTVELQDIEGPLDVRDQLNKYAQRERREYDRHQKTQWYGRGE